MSSAMINAGLEEVLIHTGQHFDHEMSQVFFDELNIPSPKYNLDVSKEMVGTQIGFIADEVESVIPEVVSKFGLKADGSTLPKNITGYGDEAGTEETFDNVKTLNYERLVVVLTKALQEADDKIEALTARIETIEGGE